MIDFVNNSEPDLTAENLNKLQQDIGTVVSATEPQGNERLKVWMQKGKNLFDGNYKSGYGYDNSTGNVITLSTVYSNQSIITVPYGATKLILSKNGEGKNTRFFFYDKNKTFLSSIVNNDGAVTIPENARYFNFQVGMNTVNNDFTKIQVETENLTSYEAYVEPKIYVLNNNDVYEEFISKEDTLDKYSTAEQKIGTWIDGKTIYRKVINLGNLPNNTTKTVKTGINGFADTITSLKGMAIGNYSFPLPFVADNWISMYAGNEATEIIINCVGNRSNFTGYAIIEYTKRT